LRVGCGATLTLAAARSLAAARLRLPPRTLDDLLDEVEQVLSAPALALIYATPEPQLLDFASGVFSALSKRLDRRAWDARDQILAAQGVPHWDDQKVFLVTALARRHRGQPFNVDEQLAAGRAAIARRNAEIAEHNRTDGTPGRKIHADQMGIAEVVYFDHGSALPAQGQDALLARLPKLLQGFPDVEYVEVVGHAARGEPNAERLSESRARSVVDVLVRGGVASARLLQHGLGARWPETDPERQKGAARDRRVDFVFLKRAYLAPTSG
jgi:outer membrane protein OmpA-like peptidoglycan-associated protein